MQTRKEAGKAGWVYAVSNQSMPGILKIGRTSRDPDVRIREMNARTETPTPFRVESVVRTSNAGWTEREVHDLLAARRVNDRREFFRVSPEEASAAMRTVAARQRQTAYDRRAWAGQPPLIGAALMTCLMVPVVSALDGRLLLPWLVACFVAATIGWPRVLREFLNISRRTGSAVLVVPSVAAIAYAGLSQEAFRPLHRVAWSVGELFLAAVRGTIGS